MSDLRDMFFEECDDLLESLSTGLGVLEDTPTDEETINAMFRAVHSIKGGAGAFGLERLIGFAHVFENVLDDVRSGCLVIDSALITLMYAAADHLAALVSAAQNGDELSDAEGAELLQDLKRLSQSEPDEVPTVNPLGEAEDEPIFVPITLNLDDASDGPPKPMGAAPFSIRIKPNAALYENGHDPALLFRNLEPLGEISVTADISGVEPLSDAAETSFGLSWQVTLAPDDGVDEDSLHEVFEFVEGLCVLDISTEERPMDALSEIAQPQATEHAEQTSEPAQPENKDLKTVQANKRNATIRVDLSRVDRLINLVGELVISESMLRQSIQELPRTEANALSDAVGQLRQLSGVIQESVMAIRAQPVRGLFQRMSRIAREAAREAHKSVRLVLEGEATEVDKTVTERLVDPLTHMIRNSVDHGLETPDSRLSAGKPEQGVIRLQAAHKSGRVVISISDDGAGIDRDRVRQIAEAKGLIRPDEDLSEADIDMLLFRPGFSTADGVSNLSGRGVGMDVVRNEIQALGGRIALHSETGQGTTLTVSLPLTLAVMEGMLVKVADEALVVPTLALRETLQPRAEDIHPLCDGDRALSLDGGLVPIVDLGAMLGFRPSTHDLTGHPLLLIEADSGQRTALAVDAIVDQREVVIKGLEQNYQQIPGIAAATILGDGKIALIVDTDQMMQSVVQTVQSGALGAPEPKGVHENV